MVKVRETIPKLSDGSINIEEWIKNLVYKNSDKSEDNRLKEEQIIYKACELVTNTSYFDKSLEIAEILSTLSVDISTIVAGILYPSLLEKELKLDTVSENFSLDIYNLLIGLEKLDLVQQKNDYSINNCSKQRLLNLRKMLLAVVEDVRVVLVKLAEHVSCMRSAVKWDDNSRQKIAVLSKDIYSPIANRLGIGQLKWELEDLSFRFLNSDIYKRIAKLLDEKRKVREEYINKVISSLENTMDEHKIGVEVSGRVKHIYSIWKKMQRKMLPYDQIYDVRAIRVLVDNIRDCYAVIGIVHSIWPNIPDEFDDYIANPKENGYKSLHTAVIGPEGKVLEIQIRTKKMHEQAELGVAAHWRYKEGTAHDPDYESKLNRLRQVLSWQEEIVLDDVEEVDSLRSEFFENRVYVFTPNGDVINLPAGSTAIDFAYHIHTDVGHRCRGAKADGKIISLTKPLVSGSKIDVLTVKEGGPSRDWLNPNLKYIATSKARAKIHQWFKQQDKECNISEGRDLILRELKRLGFEKVSIKELSELVINCKTEEDLLQGVGSGDIKITQVLGALQKLKQPKIEDLEESEILDRTKKKLKSISLDKNIEVNVDGVSGMLCVMAACCHPIPGDEIIGYITKGEGVSIHREDCSNILQMKQNNAMRLVRVSWGVDTQNTYEVNIIIKAYNRRTLLHDITSIFATEKVDIININMIPEKSENLIKFKFSIQVLGIAKLGQVLEKINRVHNVIDVYRII